MHGHFQTTPRTIPLLSKRIAMKLQFSVAARSRSFSKAMTRIDNRFRHVCNEFATVELTHPIHESILVLITDDKPPGFLEEVQ
jgi:hypothetical protein